MSISQKYTRAELVLVTIVLAVATFMQVLDSTIANVAVPTISGDLGVSSTVGTWVITGFGASNAVSIAASGFLAKKVGEVRLLLISTALFTLFSFLAGISNSIGTLIFFRVLQGAVAGPVIPLSQSLLLRSYPPIMKNMAMAFWSMTVILAPVVGPILGGYICYNYTWSWIFFINIPLGIAIVIIGIPLLKRLETKPQVIPFNFISLGLLTIGVGCLQIMLDKGNQLGWLASKQIIILAIISVVSLTYLVIGELFNKNPTVDFSLFKSRNFTIGTLSVSLAYMAYFGAIVLIPQLLQEVYGYTALWAGIALAPIGIIPILISAPLAKLSNKIDIRFVITTSFVFYAICFFWRAFTYTPNMGLAEVVWPQFIQGIAVACFLMPLTTLTLSGLPENRLASATSLSNFFRTLAGSVGTSITTTMWSNNAALHHSQLVENINLYNPESTLTYQTLERIGLNLQQIPSYLNQQITDQSLIMSANDIFWLSGCTFILLIMMIWFAKPSQKVN